MKNLMVLLVCCFASFHLGKNSEVREQSYDLVRNLIEITEAHGRVTFDGRDLYCIWYEDKLTEENKILERKWEELWQPKEN